MPSYVCLRSTWGVSRIGKELHTSEPLLCKVAHPVLTHIAAAPALCSTCSNKGDKAYERVVTLHHVAAAVKSFSEGVCSCAIGCCAVTGMLGTIKHSCSRSCDLWLPCVHRRLSVTQLLLLAKNRTVQRCAKCGHCTPPRFNAARLPLPSRYRGVGSIALHRLQLMYIHMTHISSTAPC